MPYITKNLRKLVQNQGVIPRKISGLADADNNAIIKIEAGKNQNLKFDTLKKITKALEASADDLIN